MANYKHDCDFCIFLGEFRNSPGAILYDLYYCPHNVEVVARYGEGQADYRSLRMEAIHGVKFPSTPVIFVEAARRAIAMGVLKWK